MQQPSLIERIKERIKDPLRATEMSDVIVPKIHPPASLQAIQAAEKSLGFPLPPLLRQIYLEIGNGGFGPAYGLMPILDGEVGKNENVAEDYRWYRSRVNDDPTFNWPKKLLPICELGCAMYVCIDCSEGKNPMIWFEPNPREVGDPFARFLIPLAPSLEDWLTAWLDNKDLMDEAYQKSALNEWLMATYGNSLAEGDEEVPS